MGGLQNATENKGKKKKSISGKKQKRLLGRGQGPWKRGNGGERKKKSSPHSSHRGRDESTGEEPILGGCCEILTPQKGCHIQQLKKC